MEKIVLDYINKINYQPLEIDELYQCFSDYEFSKEEFIDIIKKLIENHEVFLNKKQDRIISARQANMYKGIISVKNDFLFGFIKSSLPFDVYVSKGSLGGAFNGDEVLFSLDGYSSDEGIVQRVLKRKTEYIVGVVYKQNNLLCLKHTEKGFPVVRLKNTDKIRCEQIIRAKITKYDKFLCEANVIEVIGDTREIGMDITQVMASYNLVQEFNEEVILEANNLDSLEVNIESRTDYTDKLVFTIDGVDAKDLDDAISIKKLDNGCYELGVYIADVSYYVREGSLLDKEAYNRGTSVYLADRVIPMLPFKLSNDLCSLNPDEEKLVIACIMNIDNDGNVIESNITEGIIKSKKRLNYRDCNKVLDAGISCVPDYADVYESLKIMEELALKLFDNKYKRGALDFDVPESKVILNEEGKAVDVIKVERGISEHIIEEFMIIANETVASFIESMDLPFIYRVHDEPDGLRFQTFKASISNLGYRVKSLHPLELQRLLESIDEKDEYLKTVVLRMMAKAVYSELNIGHFGLASKSYTHFTSPIRRYPDLIVHRLLRKYLFNHQIDSSEFLELTNKIRDIAIQSSERERNATECELKVLDMKKTEYMQQFIGDKFPGVVSSVTRFGVFVTVKDSIDGLVHVSNMDGDYYEYDNYNNQYVGRRTNKKIKMGDKVNVVLINANKEANEIDFRLFGVETKQFRSNRGMSYGKNKKDKREGRSGKKNKNYRKK